MLGLRRHLIVAIGLLCALALSGCGGSSGSGSLLGDDASGVYLALGDSIAAGSGASDAATTGYPALVADALGDGIELVSLAAGGDTTQDLIDQQLPAALAEIGDGDVRLITVTIGGNDLNQYGASVACTVDPADPACPLRDGLSTVRANLETILGRLRDAAPDAVIVIEAYPNLFSGTGHMFERQAETAFGLLDDVIVEVAGRHDALIADPREEFADRGDGLTHLLDPTPDAHPNDAGYRIIADAFLEAVGLSGTDAGTD